MPPKRNRRVIASITREDAALKETEYAKSTHYQPVVIPTNKKYLRVKNLWMDFLHYIGEEPLCQEFEKMPSSGRLKHFMEWTFDTSIGILTQRVTLKTLKNTWYSFRSMYLRNTHNAILPQVGDDVLAFIKTELKQQGLAKVRRQKDFADSLDMSWLLTYLWCYDKHNFRHPRYRIQLSFLLLLIVYTGARPGTLVESSAYRGTNEAVSYEDFELIGLPTGPENTLELVLKMRFRYEKGNRDKAGELENNEHKWVALREDRNCRGRCPVTHFLALAFSDDVFLELKNPTELRKMSYGASLSRDECIPIRFQESKKKMLVFRHCKYDGTISSSRAMTYNVTAKECGEVGIRAGFRAWFRLYNLRRGTANAIDGNSGVSTNQYAQLLGHSSKVMGEHYISNLSGVDVQGIVNKETVRQDHIRLLRSMRLNLNTDAPNSLSFSAYEELWSHPSLVELDKRLETLNQKRVTEGESDNLRADIIKTTWTRKHCFAQLQQKARLRFRAQAFEKSHSTKIQKMIEIGGQRLKEGDEWRSCEKIDDDKKGVELFYLDFVSPDIFYDRHIIANGFWAQTPRLDSLPDTELIQSLKNFCIPDRYVQYYPGEGPLNGCCSICQKPMSEIPPNLRSYHIHQCFAHMHKQNASKDFQKSRPLRCRWGNCKNKFIQKYGDDNLTVKENLQCKKTISNHLKRHLKKQVTCLWDKCKFECAPEQDLAPHLWKCHGITTKQSAFEPQFCFEHPANGWYTTELDWEIHCDIHMVRCRQALDLQRSYSIYTAGIQCPFCLGARDSKSLSRYTQFTNRGTFNRHMEFHEKDTSMQCPVPSCPDPLFSSKLQLQAHFFDVHELKLKGFTQSYGIRNLKRNFNTIEETEKHGHESGSENKNEDENEHESFECENEEHDWSDESEYDTDEHTE